MRKTVLVQAIACAILSGAAHAAVKVEDKTFNTAANMLAYTEFELSGEPLAEALGLDLDVLDANRADEPTRSTSPPASNPTNTPKRRCTPSTINPAWAPSGERAAKPGSRRHHGLPRPAGAGHGRCGRFPGR